MTGGPALFKNALFALYPLLKVEGLQLFASIIKMEAFLSFLGFSLNSKIGLGQILSEGLMDMMQGYYGNFLYASLSLFGLLLSLNFFFLFEEEDSL